MSRGSARIGVSHSFDGGISGGGVNPPGPSGNSSHFCLQQWMRFRQLISGPAACWSRADLEGVAHAPPMPVTRARRAGRYSGGSSGSTGIGPWKVTRLADEDVSLASGRIAGRGPWVLRLADGSAKALNAVWKARLGGLALRAPRPGHGLRPVGRGRPARGHERDPLRGPHRCSGATCRTTSRTGTPTTATSPTGRRAASVPSSTACCGSWRGSTMTDLMDRRLTGESTISLPDPINRHQHLIPG